MLDSLRQRVCAVNLALKSSGLVTQTWGNASAIDRDAGIVAIKPSGVSYASLQPEDMVLVNLAGTVVEGTLHPSVDLPSHLALYSAFDAIGGVIHTHSHYATCFAQAYREIPCLGTTHADYFNGSVPLVLPPTPEEVEKAYEHHAGARIAVHFQDCDPLACPAALIGGHGPFVWGASLEKAHENAEVLEELARMALHTLMLAPQTPGLGPYLLEKHFTRKHGKNAYYGQKSRTDD